MDSFPSDAPQSAFAARSASFPAAPDKTVLRPAVPGKRTVLNLLRTAMQPMGTTLYVYGGGWNEQDTGAGREALSPVPSPAWQTFFLSQPSYYDYRRFLAPQWRHAGLDCSGYLGWAICAALYRRSPENGCVFPSTEMAGRLAARGLGTLIRSPTHFLPGDLFSMDGHVWLCVGACPDGSLVIAHSSPTPDRRGKGAGGGVQLTALPPENGPTACDALDLADRYMRRFPLWCSRYNAITKPRSLYTHLSINPNAGLLRFQTLPDPENIRKKDAQSILKALLY